MGNLELPYGCEITVVVQEGLKHHDTSKQEGLKNYYTSKLYKLMKVNLH